MNDEIDPKIEEINRIWRLSYGELKQRCEELEEELASARRFIYERGKADGGILMGYERMKSALYSISTLENQTLLGEGRYDEGAHDAFNQAAEIAKEALDRLEEMTDKEVGELWGHGCPMCHKTIMALIYKLVDAENVRARLIASAVDAENIDLAKTLSKKDAPIKIINELVDDVAALELKYSDVSGLNIVDLDEAKEHVRKRYGIDR